MDLILLQDLLTSLLAIEPSPTLFIEAFAALRTLRSRLSVKFNAAVGDGDSRRSCPAMCMPLEPA